MNARSISYWMAIFRHYAGVLIVGTFLFANIFIWSAVFAEEQSGVLTVAFLDVGQGDATFIETPNGTQMLIDGGPNSAVVRELSRMMPFHDRSIDIVVATHPDKDHIAGLVDVFERYEVGRYLDPGVEHDSGVYQALQNAVEEEGITPTLARRGMRIALDEEVYADILFPDRDVSTVETNLGSIVMKVVFGETEFLLTGDAPQAIEKYLVAQDVEGLRSDVLKAGHHGSKTSSAEDFVGFVNPHTAIISAGKDNSYGHPHQEVIDTFKKFDIAVRSTAEEGTIILHSDGTTVR